MSIHTNQSKKIFHELDGIRIIAISMVVLVHFMPTDQYPYAIWWQGIGVTFFFQIGVFLATLNLMRLCGKADPEGVSQGKLWGRFLLRRWLRLAPLVLTLILTLYCLGLIEPGWSLLWHATLTSNLYFALVETYQKFFDHLWFLGAHEQFLAIWSAILILRPKLSLRSILWFLLALGIIFRIAVAATMADVGRLDALFPGQLVPLSLGGLLAMDVLDGCNEKSLGHSGFGWSVMLLGIIGYFGLRLLPDALPDQGLYVVKPICDSIVCFVVLRWLLFGRRTIVHRTLSSRVAIALSHLSYGIYVWHLAAIAILASVAASLDYPLSYIMERLANHLPFAENALIPHSPSNIAFMFALSILLATVSYAIVEQPVSRIMVRFQVIPRKTESESDTRSGSVVSSKGNTND